MNQVDGAAQGALYGGATAGWVLFTLSMSEWAIAISTAIAIAGFVVHTWVLLKRHKREVDEHERRMEGPVANKKTGPESDT